MPNDRIALDAPTLEQVVDSGLCVGCGLCESVAPRRVAMQLTTEGSLIPHGLERLDRDESDLLRAVCPGIVAEARPQPGVDIDEIWGAHGTMAHGWAGDPDVRFRASTGGVLTALGMHVVASGLVDAVYHVAADPAEPLRTTCVVSRSADEVLANCGSRYGPAAPLTGFFDLLDEAVPFAVIAKPCDLGVIQRLALTDDRIDQHLKFRLAMVCGGQSRLSKSQAVLSTLGLEEKDVTLFRYRGHGNPGPTRIETTDGEIHDVSYQSMWSDEGSWDLETRCKLCPDALGEAADIVASDVWPGGGPTGEDEGFNGVIVRSSAGETLWGDAIAAGAVVEGTPITPRQFDDLQPHQVRKKHALAARYSGMSDAHVVPIRTIGLRVDQLGRNLSAEDSARERAGTAARLRRGSEPS